MGVSIENRGVPNVERRRRHIVMYQIEPAEFDRMLVEQGNCCALCRTPFGIEYKTRPHIDHSHACSTAGLAHKACKIEAGCPDCVRGLLCPWCNRTAVPFLERYPERQTEVDKAYLAGRPIHRYRIEPEWEFNGRLWWETRVIGLTGFVVESDSITGP